ncbi:efflux RND transporter periplasmic adaptor subunit [Nitrincola sp.]|uniref:efflux RND transporter periplasmic adaptor subunit n=1 Tax=Nitrincola sp. TaxID=1926584 RepID=UPI003A95B27D
MASSSQPPRATHRFIWILPLSIIALAMVGFYGLKMNRAETPFITPEIQRWNVQAQQVEWITAQAETEIFGQITSHGLATLTSAVTAELVELTVNEGQRVSENTLLASLDKTDLLLQLRQRQADYEAAQARIDAEHVRNDADRQALELDEELLQIQQRKLRRLEDLSQRNLSSQEQLDTARTALQQQALAVNSRRMALADHPNRLRQTEAELARSEALKDQAEQDLSRTEIRAPFTGRVAERLASVGERLRPGEPILSLYDLSNLEVKALLPSSSLTRFRQQLETQEQTILARTQVDGQEFTLYLDRLAADSHNSRIGIEAYFRFQDAPWLPEPGRQVTLTLQLPSVSQVVALPPQALYGNDRVYRLVNDQLEAVHIVRLGSRPGTQQDSEILIHSEALQPGDWVLTTQLPNAISGLPVRQVTNAGSNTP